MCCSKELPKNDPRIVAWEKYKQSEEYANNKRWCMNGDQFIESALWSAFLAGYEASKSES
jgi:hypothetical protein